MGNQEPREEKNAGMSWDVDVSILSSSHIMKQVAIGMGLAILFTMAVIFFIQLISGDMSLEFLAFLGKLFFALVGIFAFLITAGVLIFLGNRYEYTFTLDDRGIKEETRPRQRRRNSMINGLLLILGFLSKNPAAMGAGAMAQSRQKQFLRWKDINGLESDDRQRVIVLKRNKRTLMLVFCNPDNYEDVSRALREKVEGPSSRA